MKRNLFVFFTVYCFSLNSYSMNSRYFYIVKQNDHASSILFKANLKPIYSKSGTLALLKAENKEHIPNINKLYPGDKVYFPKKMALTAKNNGSVEITAEKEIVFHDITETKDERSIASDIKTREENAPVGPQENEYQEIKTTSAKSESENEAQSDLTFSLGTGYSRIDSSMKSTGANAVLLSRPLLSANLKWQQNWSESTQTFLRWGFNSIPYQEASRQALSGDLQNTTLMALGLNYKVLDNLWTTVELGSREETFVTSYQVGTAALEAKPISYLRLMFSKNLLGVRKLSLDGAIGFSYLTGIAGSNYEAQAGQEYMVQLKLIQKFRKLSFFALGGFATINQDTSITVQSRKNINTELGLIIPLGEEEP